MNFNRSHNNNLNVTLAVPNNHLPHCLHSAALNSKMLINIKFNNKFCNPWHDSQTRNFKRQLNDSLRECKINNFQNK